MTLYNSHAVSPAEFFDGTSALSRPVTAQLRSGNLILSAMDTDDEISRWGLTDIHWLSGTDKPVLTCSRSPDARLILEQPDLARHLLTLMPRLKKAVATDKSGKTHRMAWRYSVGAVALIIVVLAAIPWLSGPLARLATDDWRQRLGEQTSRQIETFLGPACDSTRGQAVLNGLVNKLARHLPTPEKLNVAVLDHDMINAFALPGGQIRFVNGLIKAADSGDEIAGVLAHEIAHVAYRHAEEQTFRQLGYDILLSSFGDSGAVTEIAASTGVYLASAAYSRDAETAADHLAMELLEKANIPREGMVSFFERVQKLEGEASGMLKYLSTHPATGARKQAAEASTGGGKPALSDEDWQVLKEICD